MLDTVGAVNTHGLLSDNFAMTCTAVHRIESAPMPAVRADVAVETFRRSVRGTLELNYVDLMTIVTGVFFLGSSCRHHE